MYPLFLRPRVYVFSLNECGLTNPFHSIKNILIDATVSLNDAYYIHACFGEVEIDEAAAMADIYSCHGTSGLVFILPWVARLVTLLLFHRDTRSLAAYLRDRHRKQPCQHVHARYGLAGWFLTHRFPCT